MAYLNIETRLPEKPEVMRLAEMLDRSEYCVVGHLVAFWSWCDLHVDRDEPTFTATKRGVDRIAGLSGFADALVAVNWLTESDSDQGVVYTLPNFGRHFDVKPADSVESRAVEAQPLTTGNEYKPGSDVFVPERLREETVFRAVGRWIAYLNATPTSKTCYPNSPQEQELFTMLNGWNCSADEIEQAIARAIANSWESLYPPKKDTAKGVGSTVAENAWNRVCAAVKRFDPRFELESLQNQLTAEERKAVKGAGGFVVISNRDRYTTSRIKQAFLQSYSG